MTKNKIIKLEKLAEICKTLKKQDKKIVQCHGCFELLHPGHIKHFQAAKKYGDVLIVTVTPDKFVNKGPGRPIFNQELRVESIAALDFVDYIALNKWPTAIRTIKVLKPNFYVKGQDYSDPSKDITGNISKEENAVKNIGGEIKFTNELTFSSTELINKYLSPLPQEVQKFTENLKKKITPQQIIEKIKELSDLKVLIIGDAIIDEYHYCKAVGKSEKAPTVSTKFLHDESFAGGSLAVANHVAGFVKNTWLLTCLGEKRDGRETIEKNLNSKIKTKFFTIPNSPTPTKRRYIEEFDNTKMFEVSFIDDRPIKRKLEEKIIGWLKNNLRKMDMVLITDFGHGMMTPRIINFITKNAKFIAVNAQTNSFNFGFNPVTRYKNVDFICIDERELRLPFADKFSDVKILMRRLQKKTGCNRINVTLGEKGSLCYHKSKYYSVPGFSESIVDTVGAGDALLSIASLIAYKNYSPILIPFIGNCAGALAVKIIGNKEPINPIQLFKFINGLLK